LLVRFLSDTWSLYVSQTTEILVRCSARCMVTFPYAALSNWNQIILLVDRGAKVKVYAYSQFATNLTTVGTPVLYGIILCYLPPGRGDISTFTPAN